MGISQPCITPTLQVSQGFDIEPSLPRASMQLCSSLPGGQRFEDSEELRLIGEPQSCTPIPSPQAP